MKNISLFFLFLPAISLQAWAQNQANLNTQIVGLWKLTSQKGTDLEGTPFSADASKFQQYKMITPTHWMYVSYDADSSRGSGDYGTYTLTGNKYVEALTDNYKTDFTLKVEGNKLYQDGAIIAPDGKKAMFHEVYERVEETPNPATANMVGVWDMTSLVTIKDGKRESRSNIKELQINTSSHFIWVNKEGDQFMSGMVGSYQKQGDKIIPTPLIASFPLSSNDPNPDLTVTTKGEQMFTIGSVVHKDGKKEGWECIYQRVEKAKVAKATSIK